MTHGPLEDVWWCDLQTCVLSDSEAVVDEASSVDRTEKIRTNNQVRVTYYIYRDAKVAPIRLRAKTTHSRRRRAVGAIRRRWLPQVQHGSPTGKTNASKRVSQDRYRASRHTVEKWFNKMIDFPWKIDANTLLPYGACHEKSIYLIVHRPYCTRYLCCYHLD